MKNKKIAATIISIAIASSTATVIAPESFAQTFNQYQQNTNAPADDSNFTAIFAFPHNTVKKNEDMIKKMNADMITFGPRIYPPDAWQDSDDTKKPDVYPKELVDALGTDQLYYFAGDVEWENNSNGKEIETSQGTWYAIQCAGKWVVNKKSGNKYMNAALAANNVGADFYLGMPIPQRWEKQTWLIDGSYRDVMRAFNEEYVKNYRSVVDGYYQMGEITLNASDSWQPFFDNFQDQFDAIKKHDPDAIVINSPYIRDSKKNSKSKVINDSVEGYKKLLSMSQGLNFILAPQDGLGTDTTALGKDNSQVHNATAEDVFKALSEVNKDRLFSNAENMRVEYTTGERDPNTGELLNGQSTDTTVERVKDQIAAVKNDVSGFIAYMWNHMNTPMNKISGIETLLDGGFGGLKEIAYKADDRFTVSDAYNISYEKVSIEKPQSEKLSPIMKEGNHPANKASRTLYSGGKWKIEDGYPWVTIDQLGNVSIKPTNTIKAGAYSPKVSVTFNDGSEQVIPLSITVEEDKSTPTTSTTKTTPTSKTPISSTTKTTPTSKTSTTSTTKTAQNSPTTSKTSQSSSTKTSTTSTTKNATPTTSKQSTPDKTTNISSSAVDNSNVETPISSTTEPVSSDMKEYNTTNTATSSMTEFSTVDNVTNDETTSDTTKENSDTQEISTNDKISNDIEIITSENSFEDTNDKEMSLNENVSNKENDTTNNHISESDDNNVITKKESDGSQKKEPVSQVQNDISKHTGSPVSHNAPIVQTPQYHNTIGASSGSATPGTQNPPIVDTGGSIEKSLMKKIIDSIQSLGKVF